MAKTDREVRQLKSNVQSLQSALAAIAGDIEQIGASAGSAGAAGLEQAKLKLDNLRDQIRDLAADPIARAADVGQSVDR